MLAVRTARDVLVGTGCWCRGLPVCERFRKVPGSISRPAACARLYVMLSFRRRSCWGLIRRTCLRSCSTLPPIVLPCEEGIKLVLTQMHALRGYPRTWRIFQATRSMLLETQYCLPAHRKPTSCWDFHRQLRRNPKEMCSDASVFWFSRPGIMAELRPPDPTRRLPSAQHAVFPMGRVHSSPGPGHIRAAAVWLGSCAPLLLRRSRCKYVGHETASHGSRAGCCRRCRQKSEHYGKAADWDSYMELWHGEEYRRQHSEQILRELIWPVDSDCGRRTAAADAGGLELAKATLGAILAGPVAARVFHQWALLQRYRTLIELLKDPDFLVPAREAFERNVTTELLDEYFEEIVPPLLADRELQLWSFQVLDGKISTRRVSNLVSQILDLLSGKDLPTELGASSWEFLKKQLPDSLSAELVQKLVTLLSHSDTSVKKGALHLLQERTPREVLHVLCDKILPLLSDEVSSVQMAASSSLPKHLEQIAVLLLDVMHKSPDADISNISCAKNLMGELPLLSKQRQLKHLALKLLCKLPVACLTRYRHLIASSRSSNGNTWLHVAAAEGHLEVCQVLVDTVGIDLHAQNDAGEQPLALAASREVDRFLRSRMHFRETRFGYGNAFEEMMQDERQVSEVTWYTVPLPGMAGRRLLGGLHSFLVVTVSDTEQGLRYVLEKVGSHGREAHQKHGIFIGYQDLGSNLRSVAGLNMYKRLELSGGSLRRRLKMKGLYEEAHSTGPYDLASSNCHHAVQKVFWHCCAREEDKELQPPNEWLATFGSILQLGGLFNSTSSGSEGSNSDVASANSEVVSRSQTVDSPSGFDDYDKFNHLRFMNEIDDYDNHLGLMNEIDDYDNHLRLMMNGMVRQLCEASVVEQWSFRVLDGKIMPKRGNGLITLIRDLLSGQDAPTMSRASALEFLKRQLPDNLSTEQVQVIVTPSLLYSDMDAAEWTAIEVIVALLGTGGQTYKQDARSEARQRTLHLLKEKMPSQMIAVQTEKFLPWLKSADRRTSASARHLFEQRISEEVLTEHFDTIVPPLLTDKHLHFWSIRFVTDRISRARLTDLIDLIIFQLPYQLSAPHLWEIAKFLDCLSELPYQTCISHLLRCRIDAVLAVMLSEHWETIWSPSTRTAASKLALKEASGLSRKQLVEHSRQLAALLRKAGHLDDFENIFPDLLKKSCPQHDWAELLSKLPVSCLLAVVEPEGIITWRDKSGNTWLHLAAEAGNCEACEALVDQVGHPLREKNKAGDEPLALAANREVDRILRSRMHFRETRFGHGNAFEKMMQDERQVSEVTWYTVPLPGMAGRCRGLHSFLVVTVSDTYQGEQTYVLEKAAGSFAREAHQKHGIFIGNRDLGSNLRSVDGLKMRKQVKLSNRSLQTGLEMKNFYEVAHSTGPYDLASSNCHHAVQEAFNHCCAREEDKELQPPNEWLAKLGGALQLGGLFNSASSGSGGSDSDVSSANSEVASGSQIVDSPSGFSWSGSPASDAFAEKAAALCLGVYEQDPAIALRPTEAGTVSIRNTLARPVLVYDHNSRTRHRVQADAVLKIAGCAAEKILVDIYADSWTGRCLPGRRLARRQAVWRGHRYNMSTDFRDDVVLQEAEAFVPKQSVEVLHATSKSGSSPVQWLLARSGSVLYVAFQGTSDLEDVVIDLCAVPDFHRFKDHGIGVHSGIGHALEQEGDGICHVVTDVLQALEQHRQPGERLVLCGHSLGGAYAQVMAVHLLSRNVEVTALRTFGAPHVLVPPNPQDFSALWQGLDVITSHFVHDWDPVPRIPLCKVWLTDVLPQLKQEVVRGVRIGIAQKYIEALQRNCNETRAKFLKRYDVVGEVVLVSEASGLVLVAAAPREIPLGEEAAPLKELLGEKPPGAIMTPSKLLAYHDMSVYLQLTRTMSAS